MSRPAGRTPWFPFVVVAAALALMAAQSAAPTPLYPLYAERWGFTDLTTSAVFSVYIGALAITLVIAGSLSDLVGRKPVAVASLVLVVAGVAVLAAADGVGALLVGRAIQGVASGLGFGTLGAAVLDHSPPHRHHAVSVLNASMPPLSQGVGAVLSGAAVEFLPYPYWLGFAVIGTLTAVVAVGVCVIPDRTQTRPFRWRELAPTLSCPPSPARPRPVPISWWLPLRCAPAGHSWGSISGSGRRSPGNSSTSPRRRQAVCSSSSCPVPERWWGVRTFRTEGRAVMRAGAFALIAGSALMALAVAGESFALFGAASLVGGAGFGVAFQGGAKVLMSVTAPSERGSTLSLLYLVAYVAFGLPTLLAGLAVPVVGLGPVVECYAALVALLAATALMTGRGAAQASAGTPVAAVTTAHREGAA